MAVRPALEPPQDVFLRVPSEELPAFGQDDRCVDRLFARKDDGVVRERRVGCVCDDDGYGSRRRQYEEAHGAIAPVGRHA
jgi:hypothetical protein